jgi:hypothetical protein
VRVQLNSMMEMNEVGGPLDISLQYCMWWCSLALSSSSFLSLSLFLTRLSFFYSVELPLFLCADPKLSRGECYV